MQRVSSFVFAASLAAVVVSPALADPPIAATPSSSGKLTDLHVERAPVGIASLREEGIGGQFVTMRDEIENFPLDTSFGSPGVSAAPTWFTGPSGFDWPLNTILGLSDGAQMNPWVRTIDLGGAPITGPNGVTNASKALRIKTIIGQTPGAFSFGARLRFGGGTEAAPYFALDPIPGVNARISAELYIATIEQLYTFEPVAVFSGFIAGRLMWGGVCVEGGSSGCEPIGLPAGPLTHMFALTRPIGGFENTFVPARYCTTAQGDPILGCVPHPGFQVGDMVPPPVGSWTRFASETTADGRILFALDLLDGSPEAVIFDNRAVMSTRIDAVAVNSSFEAQDAEILIDNIEASGPLYGVKKPPPLECPYFDDLEWLLEGVLAAQSSRWTVAQPSFTAVIPEEFNNQVIQIGRGNPPSDHHGRELDTMLPASSASLTNDLVASVDVLSSGSVVRALALVDGNEAIARVFIGRQTPGGPFEPGVFVQINPEYEPIDEPTSPAPLGNAPIVGVDVADTGYDWHSGGVYRTLELRISANGALRISIDGQRIYTGAGAFATAIDAFAFESENNSPGIGSAFRIDDVALACDSPSCAADFDLDDAITFADLNAVLANFGASGLPSGTINPGDADGDGSVDFADLNAVLSAFGTSCE